MGATASATVPEVNPKELSRVMAALGRRGGKARMAKLSKSQRKALGKLGGRPRKAA